MASTARCGQVKAADVSKPRDFQGKLRNLPQTLREGVNVGPDLTGSNRANLDYVLDNVLDPSAVIGKGYELNVFTMKDARVLSGIMKEESGTGYKLAMPVARSWCSQGGGRETGDLEDIDDARGPVDAMGPEMAAQLVAYLQKDAPRAVAIKNTSGAAAAARKVEGALEGENAQGDRGQGRSGTRPGHGGFRWSLERRPATLVDGRQARFRARPCAAGGEGGSYRLTAALTQARDYGIIEVSLDGKPIESSRIDLYQEPGFTSPIRLTGRA